MNILLISPYFSPAVGGVETHLDDLCKYLQSQKHLTYVRTYRALGTKIRGDKEESLPYLHIHRLNWPDLGLIFKLESYPVLKFAYVFSGLFLDCLFFLVRKSKEIDVIQTHGFIAAAMAVILGKLFNKRVVINTHVGFKFSGKGLMNKLIAQVLRQADQVLVLTKNAKFALVNIGISEKKISIYHYWVDQKIFNIGSVSTNILFNILFVGRLVEVKGVSRLIELAAKMPKTKFVIAGSGPLAPDLMSAAQKYSNIKFMGKVKNSELPKYYREASVLIVPSQIIDQVYEEGIPRVIIEALSCGLPIITTPSGGIPDIFDPKIGFMVNDDVREMQSRIEYLSSHADNLKVLSKNCREYALKHFSKANAEVIEESLQ